jgi:nucleolin
VHYLNPNSGILKKLSPSANPRPDFGPFQAVALSPNNLFPFLSHKSLSSLSHSPATPLLKPLSMAESCLISAPALFTTKTQYPFLSLPSKSIKLPHISLLSSPSFYSWVSLKYKSSPFQVVPLVAQTSDWAQQEEEEGEQKQVVKDEEEGSSWKTQGLGETVAGVASNDGGDGWGGGEESSKEGILGGSEEFYPEPPEEAKLFVGNLPYDMDSEKLAEVFNEAGVVEIAEVKFAFLLVFVCVCVCERE